VDVFARLELVVLLARKDAEGMGTEVVTLSLEEVGRDDLAAVAIEEGESGAESGGRNTPEDGLSDNSPPTGLGLVNGCDSISLVNEGHTMDRRKNSYPC
jgi:hypothetical protein